MTESQQPAREPSQDPLVERLLGEFEDGWKSGRRPDFEKSVSQLPPSQGEEGLAELLYLDLFYRQQSGESPSLDEYLSVAPNCPILFARTVKRVEQAFEATRTHAMTDGDGAANSSGAGATSAGNRFQILRPHARGGLGEVFVARDGELNREVALKRIQDVHADHPESRARFVVEAEITGGLEHPGIVPVYGLGSYADGRPYYAMRFIRGDSLKDAIERFHKADEQDRDSGERSLELRKLLGRFIDVCNAIEYAHSRGILHRDLKPGNIMLGKYGETLVVDWGLAKAIGRQEKSAAAMTEMTLVPSSGSGSTPTQMGSALGTPAFMSPEQAAGNLDLLSPATDVYSLGATLYSLLTGKLPFEGHNLQALLERVKQGDVRPLRQANKRVPAALEAICLKAMALRPVDRYNSARALADDLEHWMADEPIVARQDTLVEKVFRFTRRHKAWTSSVGAVMIAGIAASLIALGLINQQRRIAEGLADDNAALARQQSDARQRAEEAEKSALAAKREAETAKDDVLASSRKLQHQLALGYVEQGSDEAEHGNIAQSVARFYQAYQVAGHDDPLRPIARRLLCAWAVQLPCLLPRGAVFSPNRRTVAGASRLWDAYTGEPLAELPDHSSLMFSPDGKSVLLLAKDMNAWTLCDAVTGEATVKSQGSGEDIRRCVFSPDGKSILTWGQRNAARLWDTTTGKVNQQSLKFNIALRSAFFSSDNRTILAEGQDHQLRIWDVATGEMHGQPIPMGEFALVDMYDPIGNNVLASGTTKNARNVWDVSTGKLRGELKHAAAITGAAFSPDGKSILTASADKTAQLWDASTCARLGEPLMHEMEVRAAKFSPDGRTLLTLAESEKKEADKWRLHKGGGAARLWDAATRKPRGEPIKGATKVVFTPDSRTLLVFDGMIQFWDVATGTRRGKTLKDGFVMLQLRSSAVSPDGRTIATADVGQTAVLWEASTAKPLGGPLPHNGVVATTFSPGGRNLLTIDASNPAADPIGGRLWELPVRKVRMHRGTVLAVAFSPDGQTILTGSADNTARLWDSRTLEPRGKSLRHTGAVNAVAFSPDGKTILTGSADKTARLWDRETCEPRSEPLAHPAIVTAVAFSPNGVVMLTACADKTARLWHAATGAARGEPIATDVEAVAVSFDAKGEFTLYQGGTGDGAKRAVFGSDARRQEYSFCGRNGLVNAGGASPIQLDFGMHGGSNWATAFSPDGRTILAGRSDKTAQLWDAATGRKLGDALEHGAIVNRVDFSPDGKLLFTQSFAGTARLWDAATGKPYGPPIGHDGAVAALAFSPDGQTILTGSDNGTLRLLRLPMPPVDDPACLAAWMAVRSGVADDGSGTLRPLKMEKWLEAWQQLKATAPDWLREQSRIAHGDAALWHLGEADQCEAEQSWFAAAYHLNVLLAEDPTDFELRVRRGWANAELGLWDKATADFTPGTTPDTASRYRHALSMLAAGQLDGYRKACGDMAQCVTASQGVGDRAIALRLLVITPERFCEPQALLQLAESTAGGIGGASLYRAGKFDECLTRLKTVGERYNSQDLPPACVDLFLAMTYQRLRQAELARKHLDQARSRLEHKNQPEIPALGNRRSIPVTWEERLLGKLLLAEAAALEATPAVPEPKPADPKNN